MTKKDIKKYKERIRAGIKIIDPYMLCWEWQKSKDRYGYGRIKYEGKMTGVHRVVYQLFNGPIPDDLQIRHLCHNRACCNPKHLLLGTHQDNMNDMRDAGRKYVARGEDSGNAKLTEMQVLNLHDDRLSGQYTLKQLATKYNISLSQTKRIANGDNWSHLHPFKLKKVA